MQLYRSNRGGEAVMVVECDQEVPQEGIKWLEKAEGVGKVTYLSLEDLYDLEHPPQPSSQMHLHVVSPARMTYYFHCINSLYLQSNDN